MTEATASFRDPAGRCCVFGQRVVRAVSSDNARRIEAFLQTPTAQSFRTEGKLVSTARIGPEQAAELRGSPQWRQLFEDPAHTAFFEHERIPFQSYPYEWPPEMIWQAGMLTLDLATSALRDGFNLKDATPYNVLYRGCEPVFTDVASFEPRTAGDAVWRPYAQFVRTFLLPLLANERWRVTMADIFTTHRDGLEPEQIYALCGCLERLNPRILSLVSLPTWLRGKARSKGAELYQVRKLADEEKARFIVESLLKQLRRALESLKPEMQKKSAWSDYMTSHRYTEPAFAAKVQFVREVLDEYKPAKVLDIGANTGTFSVQAARAGAEVVAIDLDPGCVGAIWQEGRAQKLNILPLVVDLSRPSPAVGWRNLECPSFIDRAGSSFDCVLILAVLHHLLVTERIPLSEVLSLASSLTTSVLVIEFVAPDDPMFHELMRGRDELHSSLNQAVFEKACAVHFDIIRSQQLPDARRTLYALRKRGVSA